MTQNKRNILIVGGSGYVGSEIVRTLHEEYNFINISQTRLSELASNNIRMDITKGMEFLNFSAEIDVIINCTEILECARQKEYGRCYADTMQQLVAFAAKNRIKKIIHFSNHIQDETFRNDYIHNKILAERVIEHCGMEFIIFKPTLIFGKNSVFDTVLKRISDLKLLSRNIAHRKFSPVYIGDVMRNVSYALGNEECWNKSYVVCGPEYMALEEALTRYNIKMPSIVKMPDIVAGLQFRRALEKPIFNFYKRLMDYEVDRPVMEYPSLLKPQKFY